MDTLPADLQVFWNDTVAADRRAEQMSAKLTDTQFLWAPDGGRRWSVALCLDHLAVANDVYGRAIAEGIAKARQHGWTRKGPAQPGLFGRMFANSLEPPVKIRSGAPGKIKPMPQRSRTEILAAYRTAHDGIRALLAEAAGLDCVRATFANPFFTFVKVSVATGFQVVSAHDRRHLWQADNVVSALEDAGVR